MLLMLQTRSASSKLGFGVSVLQFLSFGWLGIKMFLENRMALYLFPACEPVPTMEICNVEAPHLISVVGCYQLLYCVSSVSETRVQAGFR
jgi:hypothetical protein